jgi:NhaP-type Na+/H+ or K+/H+ antiporter
MRPAFIRNFRHTMFEAKSKPLLPRRSYYARLARSAAVGLLVIVIALGTGMFGYHHFEGMSWIDAFANAAMILSGMGPLAPLNTANGKLFAGFYALFSGLLFVVVMGIVFAPVVHRFMHRFHLEDEGKDAKQNVRKASR